MNIRPTRLLPRVGRASRPVRVQSDELHRKPRQSVLEYLDGTWDSAKRVNRPQAARENRSARPSSVSADGGPIESKVLELVRMGMKIHDIAALLKTHPAVVKRMTR